MKNRLEICKFSVTECFQASCTDIWYSSQESLGMVFTELDMAGNWGYGESMYTGLDTYTPRTSRHTVTYGGESVMMWCSLSPTQSCAWSRSGGIWLITSTGMQSWIQSMNNKFSKHTDWLPHPSNTKPNRHDLPLDRRGSTSQPDRAHLINHRSHNTEVRPTSNHSVKTGTKSAQKMEKYTQGPVQCHIWGRKMRVEAVITCS